MKAFKNGASAMAMVMASAALTGCGGSETSSSAPANHAPSITSAAAASVVENSTGSVYQASATDSDGDPVTFTLAGTDAARFTMSATGELRFVTPPNFEKPGDADADNAYVIQVSATDGKATVSQAVTITVSNSKESVEVQRIATGFDHPVAIVTVPQQPQLMIAERTGAIYTYDPVTQQKTLFANVEGLSVAAEGQGILSIAVAPNASLPTIYVLIARSGDVAIRQIYVANGQVGYAEFSIGRRASAATPTSGWLGFGADGLLYAATGDAGGTTDPSGSAQDRRSLFGKLLSFSQLNFDIYGGASVPPPITPTLLASGLHNPSGGTFLATGLLLPDRGQSQREEVNALTLNVATIDNLGWPYREGTAVVAPNEPSGLLPPVLEYPHGDGLYAGRQIVGGLAFQGSNASLAGTYLFVDSGGAVFTVPLASLQRGSTIAASSFERRDLDFTPETGSFIKPLAIVQDGSGAIYFACDNGDIFRATAK